MAQKVVFAWGREFETNIKQVDAEHRYLVEIINSLGLKLSEQNITINDLDPIFQELLRYTNYHFSNEEDMMKRADIDVRHSKKHIEEHKNFIKEVSQKYSSIKKESIKKEAKELLDFLVSWLTFHILGVDKNLSAQIRLIESGFSPERAYEEISGINQEQLDIMVKSFSGIFSVLMKYNEELVALKTSLEEKIKQRTQELVEANAKLELANKKLEIMAMKDQLTGLANRRQMNIELENCWKKFINFKENFSVILLDLDNFKYINDTFGHEAGDILLQKFSETLLSNLRESDLACRMGGDEFLSICPNTNENEVQILVKRLHKALNNLKVELGEGCWFGSVSVGVASFSKDFNKTDELIKAADYALYQAKNAGKNKIVFYNELTLNDQCKNA